MEEDGTGYHRGIQVAQTCAVVGDLFGNLGLAYLNLEECEASLRHLLPAFLIMAEVESPDVDVVEGNIVSLQERMGEGPFRALAERLARETGTLVSVEDGQVKISPAGPEAGQEAPQADGPEA